ncbi:MAG: nucleotidyltransferase family protein [Vicinamibacterales bacterium]
MARTLHDYLISPEADAALECWACAVINGSPQPFPPVPSVSSDLLLRFTEFHGITGLMYARTIAVPSSGPPDMGVADAVSRAARHQAAREMRLQQELGQVLAAADARGLTPLILKGTALAYSLYPEPALRGRNDTDLLVATSDKAGMMALLEGLGYVGDLIAGEHWATSERSFKRRLSEAMTSCIDVHWRINNSPVFWHADLGHSSLIANAQPLAALHPKAVCPDRPALLLHACIHRASHVRAPMLMDGAAYVPINRLIWLYDIHLLSGAMNADDWSAFLVMAVQLRMRGICRSAIAAAATRFGTTIPESVLVGLEQQTREATTEHLDAPSWQMKLTEFRALPSNHARLGWLREHLLPSRAYMRSRYALNSRAPLVLLYIKRLMRSRRSL